MRPDEIHIGIVDDHTLVRHALAKGFAYHTKFKLILEAGSGDELFEKLIKNSDVRVDVLLLDFYMQGLNGKEVLQLLRIKYPMIKVIMLSMNSDPEIVSELLDLGIYGYLPKYADFSELEEAVIEVSKGILYQNKLLTQTLYWRTGNSISNSPARGNLQLNEKQKRILELIWQEKNTEEIAREVCLSVSAVDKIKHQLKEMTGAKTTVGLIKYGIKKKII